MSVGYQIVLSGTQHQSLVSHLLPEDGREAAAILLCRDLSPVRTKLIVHSVLPVPYGECRTREPDWITWPGARLSDAIDIAEDEGMSIILIHSHPGGHAFFSSADDESDRLTIPNIFSGWSGQVPQAGHGSAVMAPGGVISARLYTTEHACHPVDQVVVVGDDIKTFPVANPDMPAPMGFGSSMTHALNKLHACIVGVSGTGSVIAEQAARMGFGALTLVDFDRVEHKNLNRILGTTSADAEGAAIKVEVVASAIRRYRPDITVTPVASSIFDRDAVLAAAKADVLFSCVDGAEGRQICDLISQAFFIPLIDMGVTIPTRKTTSGGVAVADVIGRIDYVQPHGVTLADRQVFTPAMLRAEYLARVDPEAYKTELDEGYIRGAPNEAPSVIALNMRAASAAMLEFIARMFPFRQDSNAMHARTIFSLGEGEEEHFAESEFSNSRAVAGQALTEPLLGLPELGV